MILDIAKMFWDKEQGKLKKGRALLLPVICLVGFLIYLGSKEAYAVVSEFVDTKIEGEHLTLHNKVEEVDTKVATIEIKVDQKVPLTTEDVINHLKDFKTEFQGEQSQLYQKQLDSQSHIFQQQSENMKEGVNRVVDIVLTKQTELADRQYDLSKEVGKITGLIEIQNQTNIDQNKRFKELAEELKVQGQTAQKDREGLITLQKNQNLMLRDQALLEEDRKAFRNSTEKRLESQDTNIQKILNQLQKLNNTLERDN